MINRTLNWMLGWLARRALRAHFAYPADTTALVLLNAQRGFLSGDAKRQPLHDLVHLARSRGWPIVHAPFQADASMRFPTPAHLHLATFADQGAELIVDVMDDDIVLDGSARLSAFADSDLTAQLRARGLERLILAGPLAELRVDSTLRDGVEQDFHITVAREACPTGPAIRNRAIYERTWARYAHAIARLDEIAKRAAPPNPVGSA